LENNESEAEVFVCELMKGEIPEALESLGEDIVDEFANEFDALTSFVMALPSLVPEVLEVIESGGEEAVSIVEELITNPGGAITVVENGVKSVFTDLTDGVKCLLCNVGIGDCPHKTLSSSCSQILASISTAPQSVAATATGYKPVVTSTAQTQATPTTYYAHATTASNGNPSRTGTTTNWFSGYDGALLTFHTYLFLLFLGLAVVMVVMIYCLSRSPFKIPRPRRKDIPTSHSIT
jgi:hypothetical protein